MASPHYPVRVDAWLDPQLGRWLWLVKWLLAIPHFIVLTFLWLAFFVLSIVAFFAILFTARYPRGIFDFNVGVLRWSWRVAYYAYGALGTDRYPPFTLADVPDYPAHFSVHYPERLSRGLVLVKWWLLAIPHYLVIGLFLDGGWYVTSDSSGDVQSGGPGLISILVLVAAVVLLFTGKYPQHVFDFVLGLDRWVLRVAGYVALMTDEYPPFRLDMGGSEDGAENTPVVEGPSAAEGTAPTGQTAASTTATGAAQETGDPTATGTAQQTGDPTATGAAPATGDTTATGDTELEASPWTAGRVVSVVVGSVFVLLAGGLLTTGGALALVDQTQRDDDDFLMTDSQRWSTSGYGLASEEVDLRTAPGTRVPGSLLGDAKFVVDPEPGQVVFVGIADAADLDEYLAGVDHSTVTGFEDGKPTYRRTRGGSPASPPGSIDIWEASVSGQGEQTLTWPIESGEWAVVVMNEDASAPVTAKMAVGATVPALGWVIATLLLLGGLVLLVGLVLIFATLGLVGRSRREAAVS